MKSMLMIFACLVVIAAATSNKGGNASVVADLTTNQRLCIVGKVRNEPSIMTSLNDCKKEAGGLACIKAIPALASCFA